MDNGQLTMDNKNNAKIVRCPLSVVHCFYECLADYSQARSVRQALQISGYCFARSDSYRRGRGAGQNVIVIKFERIKV